MRGGEKASTNEITCRELRAFHYSLKLFIHCGHSGWTPPVLVQEPAISNSLCHFNVHSSLTPTFRLDQDTLKTAFLADQQIAPRGFEPLESNQQDTENKELTENTNPVFVTGLAKIMQEYPELRELVMLWPDLPEDTKTTFKKLIETHSLKSERIGKRKR